VSAAGRSFESLYGAAPTTMAQAPGRVNLIGEHTDYSGGFVLPTAIPLRTQVELRARSDASVVVSSVNVESAGALTYVLGQEARGRGWLDYVQGVTFALRAASLGIGGFEALVHSDIPLGAGLSSSAALEVALLRALRSAFALSLDDVTLARLARAAETELVGAPVGIMDPMACSLAHPHEALFLDTRSLDFERLPLPPEAELVVIDSGAPHDHATGDYRTRRAETERAAYLLGVRELRDIPIARLGDLARLPRPLDRRAHHVVTENARVLDAVAALREGDVERLGALFAASHASMRDDFQVSVPVVDELVAIAAADADVYGARLTGGGFGGAIVALVRAGTGRDVAERVTRTAGGNARALVPARVS
jgi:galactokinase